MGLKTGMFLILLIATLLLLFVSVLAFRRKDSVARYCAWVMMAASTYSLGYGFEMISTSLGQAKFWLNVQYIGIPFIATLWLMLVLNGTKRQAMLNKWGVPALFVIPLAALILYYSNDLHGLWYSEVHFDPDSSRWSPIVLSRGPGYWVFMAYTHAQVIFSLILCVSMYMKASSAVRKQAIMLMIGSVAPWVANLVYLSEYDQLHLDLTPFGFVATALLYIWGIYRFNLLHLVPVAYRKVFETIQDGAMIIDEEHRIMHANHAAKRMFGGLKAWRSRYIAADQLFASDPDLLAMLHASASCEGRVTIRQGSETRYYQAKMSVIYDKSQAELGRMLLFSDITQVVMYQEQLIANANRMEELFTVVTHDIRDPLALLVSLTEIIEEEFVDSRSANSEVFHEVSGKVREAYLLVDNLLDWFRNQKEKISLRLHVWELEPIIRHAVRAMESRARMKNIRVTVEVQGAAHVYADREMLESILRNLLSNAIKYTGPDGIIHVEAARSEDRVTVFVRDSGEGVDPEVGESLFRDVQQAASLGTYGERGTGLGLYLCGKFVRMNGGDIWYESVPGQGSTFCFTLPADETLALRQRTWKEVDER